MYKSLQTKTKTKMPITPYYCNICQKKIKSTTQFVHVRTQRHRRGYIGQKFFNERVAGDKYSVFLYADKAERAGRSVDRKDVFKNLDLCITECPETRYPDVYADALEFLQDDIIEMAMNEVDEEE
jgi:hypothetical protein